jgi:hypothetical protein
MELKRIGRNADDPGDVNDVSRFLNLYEAGELGQRAVAVIAHTSAKYGAGWEHAVTRKRFVDDEDGQVFEALTCPTCGSPIQINLPGGFTKVATSLDDLGDKRRFCETEISGYELDDKGRLYKMKTGSRLKRIWHTLFWFTDAAGNRRIHCETSRGAFKPLIADECHELPAKASDRVRLSSIGCSNQIHPRP